MPDPALRDLVLARLDKETQPEDAWSALVLAALDGEAGLAQVLDQSPPNATKSDGKKHSTATAIAVATAKAAAQATAPTQAPHAYLHSITVEGFRGIGPKATLDLPPGPGLTLVVGRNGSGKSSFAEALELLLTGDTYRWSQRTRVWREGWRNLHHPQGRIAAEFLVAGAPGRCKVERTWPDGDGASLEAGETLAQLHGQPQAPLASLGWGPALTTYRPFLSYSELGSLLDEGPSKLFDALASILGLDELVDAQPPSSRRAPRGRRGGRKPTLSAPRSSPPRAGWRRSAPKRSLPHWRRRTGAPRTPNASSREPGRQLGRADGICRLEAEHKRGGDLVWSSAAVRAQGAGQPMLMGGRPFLAGRNRSAW